jgi:hypothetical protein
MHWKVEWAATVAQNAATDLADTVLLIEVCLDCLEHRVDGSEAKLEALLKMIDRDLSNTLRELPGALEVILEVLKAQEGATEPGQE